MRQFLYPIISGKRTDLLASIVRLLLWGFSLIYGAAARVWVGLYNCGIFKKFQLSVPVVSIGNLTMGGSGKTPMAIFVARLLKARQLNPVIVTRGYRPGHRNGSEELSDEVKMLKELLPDVGVVVNPDRYHGGLEAIRRYQANVIILDDGFQHWKLKRDLDIVLIDCSNPFGSGYLLPAGILREPVSAIQRAQLIVLTKTDRGNVENIKKQLDLNSSGIPVVETQHVAKSVSDVFLKEDFPLNRIVSSVIAFCGLGEPLSFKETLVKLGADVKEFIAFSDHYEYTREDMQKIRLRCEELGVRNIVTTRKDAVKLEAFKEFWQGFNCYMLNIEIEITKGHNEFNRKFDFLSHR